MMITPFFTFIVLLFVSLACVALAILKKIKVDGEELRRQKHEAINALMVARLRQMQAASTHAPPPAPAVKPANCPGCGAQVLGDRCGYCGKVRAYDKEEQGYQN